MTDLILFEAVAVLVPLVAVLLDRAENIRISERHHSHHDTYVAPVRFTRAIVAAIAFMGVLGVVLGSLCEARALPADPLAVVGFFDGFVVMGFVLWWEVCRYKVAAFGDCMVVTPFVGPDAWVRYDQIERLEWVGLPRGSGYRDLAVWVGGRPVTRLSSLVDLERVLMRIDRFDVLPTTL